ncbi:MAG TPA: cyclic nucleotide-binding domain-containing protein [Actinomycetota bacterium]|nr:cyclic nucleotide-binding domain-containing protein [Actinomycetota bacterium]
MVRMLGLRPEERRTVALAAATAGLGAAGLTIAASGVDALLFARDGVEALPGLYVLLGITMFLASLGVSALLGRLGRGRTFLAIPASILVISVVAWVALLDDPGWVYRALWIVRGAAEFLVGLAVWGLAGLVTDTRQAKRWFPLIGAAAVLGQVVGGLLTRPLASWLGTEALILVWSATLVTVVVFGRRLVAIAGAEAPRSRRRRPSAVAELVGGLRDALRSPLLRWMSVGSILFSLLFFSLYLPFSRAAVARFPAPDDLAGFLGLFMAISTGVTLLLSLFVMNRLLARVGIPVVMLVLPILYLVAFGVLTVAASFAILLAFRFAQVVWLQGGASSTWEAVINTVPGERRDRMRAFLYGGPTQVGTVLAGVVALIGERAVSPRVLYAIGLVAAGGALYAMFRVRRAYAAELVVALREGRPHVFGGAPGAGEPFGLARADRAATSVAVAAMDDPDASVRRVAAELLGGLDPGRAVPALIRGVHDLDAEVRAASLRSLARAEAFEASDEIPPLLADPVPEVRLAALDALDALRADRARARGLLADGDGLVRARAAGILLAGGSDAEADAALARLSRSPHAEMRAAALRELAASTAAGTEDLAIGALSDPAPSVRTEAARTVLAIDPTAGVERLLATVDVGDGETKAFEVAAQAVAADPERAAGPVRHLAASAGACAMESRHLADSIEPDGDERLTILRDSLVDDARAHAMTAFRAIGLLHGSEQIEAALESVSAADPVQRANALEVIETIGDRQLVRPLLGLWEPSSGRTDPDWHAKVLHHPDERIRAYARWALADARGDDHAGGAMTETLTTIPTMERVLFLRRVPLFADLPPQDLLPIATIASEHTYEDADTIAEQGEPGDEMYIIVTGYVMVILRGADGHQQVLAVRSAGEVLGEMAVITSAPRMASLAAKGPVRLLTIARRPFEAMIRDRPETSLALLRVLCQRLADSESALVGGPGDGRETVT